MNLRRMDSNRTAFGKRAFHETSTILHSKVQNGHSLCPNIANARLMLQYVLLITFFVSGSLMGAEPPRYQWTKNDQHQFAVEIRFRRESYWEIHKAWPEVRFNEGDDETARVLFRNAAWVRSTKTIPEKEREPQVLTSPNRLLNLAFVKPQRISTIISPIDRRGQSDFQERERLPYLLGSMQGLLFDLLPNADEKQWSYHEAGTLTVQSQRMQLGRRGLPMKYTSQAKYQLESLAPEIATIHKAFDLMTEEQQAGAPRIELTGNQTLRFDRTGGLISSLKFSGQLTIREEQYRTIHPIEISAHLMTDEERAEQRLHAEREAQAKSERIAARRAEQKRPFTKVERDQILKQLQRGEKKALSVLADKRPDTLDSEISDELLRLYHAEDLRAKKEILKAIAAWGDEKCIPILIEALGNSNSTVVQLGADGVVRLQAMEALPILIEQMKDSRTRYTTSRILQLFGASAEDEVLKLLTLNDRQLHISVLQILRKIGTEKSLVTLRQIQTDQHYQTVASFIRLAIAAIEARLKL